MNLLVFNGGSSSLTFKVYKTLENDNLKEILKGKAHRVGVKGDKPSFIEFKNENTNLTETVPLGNHQIAVTIILETINRLKVTIDIIGHRWANGLDNFTTAEIDKNLLTLMQKLVPIIPIHHAVALMTIKACAKIYPKIPQFVTTDNAFHKDIPRRAFQYILPQYILEKFRFRKYGFHGLSFQYITETVPDILKTTNDKLKMIICHLGTGGSEINAVKNGKSIDISMGYTGIPGIVMSTRCGDIDAFIPMNLISDFGYTIDEVQNILNNKSGLLSLSEKSSDIRDIIERSKNPEDVKSQLALKKYIHSVKRYIGAFISALQGIDCLIFTDDAGLQCAEIRKQVCADMKWCGIDLDIDKNTQAQPDMKTRIDSKDSIVKILIIPTDEEIVIAEEVVKLYKMEEVLL